MEENATLEGRQTGLEQESAESRLSRMEELQLPNIAAAGAGYTHLLGMHRVGVCSDGFKVRRETEEGGERSPMCSPHTHLPPSPR